MAIKDLEKIKVVSDGTMVGTKIFDHEGKPVLMLQEITIKIDVMNPVPRAELVLYLPELDLEGVEVTDTKKVSVPYYELGSGGEPVGRVTVLNKKK